jgi:subtilisin family serine protease
VRRSASLVLAAVLAIPLSMQIATPASPSALRKLSPAMAELVKQRGYHDPKAFAKVVRSLHAGDVYYFASVRGRLDNSLARSLQRAGARVRVAFPEINTVAVSSSVGSVLRVAALDRVTGLEVDGLQRLHGASVQYVSGAAAQKWGDQHKRGTVDVGADKLWSAGIDGAGVTIGVADSGVDSTHPDLNDLDWLNWGGSHSAKVAFADCQLSAPTILTGDGLPTLPDVCNEIPGYDDNGHGTHVSGIATGTAQGRGQEGLYPGMAPGSLLRVAKVCQAAGTCLNSNVMAGMRWLAMEKSEGGAGADIINMSLGSGRLFGAPIFAAELVTNNDTEAALVNALSQKYNTLFVISAGNSGPMLGSLGSPAVAHTALAVGAAVADFDRNHPESETLHGELGNIQPLAAKKDAIALAAFSSRGPSGDRMVKPDVVAPGVYIVAAESLLGAEVHAGDVAHRHSFSADPTYAVLSGTSMAAPSAAGVAALVASGYKKMYGDIPAFWKLKAALTNTAGTKAMEGPVVGLIFGTVVANGLGKIEDHYPVRNSGMVGVTGTGAGRVNAPAALLALAKGVIAYSPVSGALDGIRELQPSWGMDDIVPGGSARTSFIFEGAPKMAKASTVAFKMVTEGSPAGMYEAPASWFTLPRTASVAAKRKTPVTFGLRVPSNAEPGAYTATIRATVKLGSVTQTIGIPVQFFVRMLEPNLEGGSSLEGPIWAADVTDYSIVGFENPIADIETDWTMIPIYVPKGATRIDFSVYDVAGKDHMDLFVFDSAGMEIDSTVSFYDHHIVPNGALYLPTSKAAPATMSIFGPSPDGNDTTDAQEDVTLPQTIWIAVSDSGPSKPASMARYHLDVDMIGAASTGIGGVTAPAVPPAPKPRPRAGGAPLPATGVGSSASLAAVLLVVAAAVATRLRFRTR